MQVHSGKIASEGTHEKSRHPSDASEGTREKSRHPSDASESTREKSRHPSDASEGTHEKSRHPSDVSEDTREKSRMPPEGLLDMQKAADGPFDREIQQGQVSDQTGLSHRCDGPLPRSRATDSGPHRRLRMLREDSGIIDGP